MNKLQKQAAHQREVFLFNDLLVVSGELSQELSREGLRDHSPRVLHSLACEVARADRITASVGYEAKVQSLSARGARSWWEWTRSQSFCLPVMMRNLGLEGRGLHVHLSHCLGGAGGLRAASTVPGSRGMLAYVCMCVCVCTWAHMHVHVCTSRRHSAFTLQLCLTLCDSMDCSPPGSSVHGILQARILDWVAMPSFRESS